jgi:uncharacterized protein YegJ (DUF2314 family)
MKWFEKKVSLLGSVLFRGTIPPALHELELPAGCDVDPMPASPGIHWGLKVSHKKLGQAQVMAVRNPPAVHEQLFAFQPSLSEADRKQAVQGKQCITVRIEQASGHMLRDRKRLLTFLGGIMGTDGVIALDHLTTRAWTRRQLDDELSHDADCDIDALFVTHAIGDETGEGAGWVHTHGLGELNAFDFDILRPATEVIHIQSDILRSLAFASLEETLKPGELFEAFSPGGAVLPVDAGTFMSKAPADERALRAMDDDSHQKNRVVLCAPAKAGFLSRLFGSKVRAASCFASISDNCIMPFSTAASDLLSERARNTWSRCLELFDELAPLKLPLIVKAGYVVDGGSQFDREHMWFRAEKLFADSFYGELIVNPFNIARMNRGDKARHDLDLVSDWQFMTPAGSINPRTTGPLRFIRENREKLLKAAEEEE